MNIQFQIMKEIWLLVGVATLIPISTPNLSHDKGIFVGRNIYTNAPVYIDRLGVEIGINVATPTSNHISFII